MEVHGLYLKKKRHMEKSWCLCVSLREEDGEQDYSFFECFQEE